MPESDRPGSLRHCAVDQRQNINSVDRQILVGNLNPEKFHDGGIDVAGNGRHVGDRRLANAGWPFDDAGHPDTAFPKLPLVAAQMAVGAKCIRLHSVIHPSTIITIEPNHCVIGDAELAKSLTQRPHTPIHAHHLAIVRRATCRLKIRGRWGKRHMRASKPDDSKKWFLFLGISFDELKGLGHDGIGAVTLDFRRLTIAAECPVGVEPVGNREPLIEAEVARMQRVTLRQRPAAPWLAAAQVPFSEMRSRVTNLLHRTGNCLFLKPQRHSRPVALHTVGMAAGHHACTRRRTAWVG